MQFAVENKTAYLERKCVLVTNVTSEFDYDLHALDFALNDFVEILLINLRESKEVDGTCIGLWIR